MRNIIVFKNRVTKIFCFLIFGLSSVILSYSVFPILGIIFTDKKKSARIKRKLIRRLFRIYITIISVLACKIKAGDYKRYSKLKSTIVVSNHPSLLDIVFIMTVIPNADCLVSEKLHNNFFLKNIVRDIYINSGAPPKEIIQMCQKSIDLGNNIIIFPEGTRSTSDAQNIKIKKGAAQIAIRVKANILPIYIKAYNNKGLSKEDSIFKVQEKGFLLYELIYKEIIYIENYISGNLHTMVRLLTKDIKDKIIGEI